MIDLSVPPLEELTRRRSEKWDGCPSDVIASTVAEMDYRLSAPIARELRAAISRSDTGYAYQATARLREAFVGFAGRRFGWSVDPDQITLIPDVMVGIIEVARLVGGPGGSVAFASPAYPPFFAELPCAGLQLKPIRMLADGAMDLDELEQTLARGTRVVLLANPHNPTGRVLPLHELVNIADICRKYDAWVIADEIHAPLVLGSATHIPWLTVSESARERGVSLISASKCFNIAGLKCALLITGSERMREKMRELPYMGERAGLLGVVAAEAAFEEGDAWLDAVLAQLTNNRELLRTELSQSVPGIRWHPPDGTYLAWLDFRALGLGDDPAGVILRRGRIALSPGLHYGALGAGFARLNFGTSAELVKESVRRIARALH
jgi:cystathionine beta-lyase